jgi:Replication protein
MSAISQPLMYGLAQPPPKNPKPEKYIRERRETKEEKRKYAEISFMQPPATKEEETFRHSAWARKRKLVEQTLRVAGTGKNALENFANCGNDAIVQYDPETKKLRVSANHCKCRHCEPCMRAKGNLLAGNLKDQLDKLPQADIRFVTLTLKHTTTSLEDQLKRLNKCWKNLRASRVWKGSQRGGAAILEIKWSKTDKAGQPSPACWHAHLHIITQGTWIAQRELADEWYRITGDSYIVDIKKLEQNKDAAYYVCKYVGKGVNNEVWSDQAAAIEFVCAMRGVRTCATFGTWRGFKLLEHVPDEIEWTSIGRLSDIVQRAIAGEEWAKGIMLQLNEQCKYDPHKARKPSIEPGG